MMQHSPILKMLGMITWLITALVSINMFTTALFGCDGLAWLVSMMPGMSMALVWIIGLSGVISLAMLVKAAFMCCPGCGACPCNCNSK